MTTIYAEDLNKSDVHNFMLSLLGNCGLQDLENIFDFTINGSWQDTKGPSISITVTRAVLDENGLIAFDEENKCAKSKIETYEVI